MLKSCALKLIPYQHLRRAPFSKKEKAALKLIPYKHHGLHKLFIAITDDTDTFILSNVVPPGGQSIT